MKIAPKNFKEFELDTKKLQKMFTVPPRITPTPEEIKLRDFQEEAVEKWLDNDKKGILAMATGTGKTFTALGCLNETFKAHKRIICIISAPYNHLVDQWFAEFDKIQEKGSKESFGELLKLRSRERLIIGGKNYKWKKDLLNNLADIDNGLLDRLVILTTHDTFAHKLLVENIQKTNVNKILIADEMHGLGSKERRKGLIDAYKMRLGLSATPKRWMDEKGTDLLVKYFDDVIFEFSIEKAIKTINPSTGKGYLTKYYYYPHFIDLTEDEMYEYLEISKKISMVFNFKDNSDNSSKQYDQLLFKRANIIKKAENKIKKLPTILKEIKKEAGGKIKDVLIYCADMEQLEEVTKVLYDFRIRNHKFTGDESIRNDKKLGGKSEREDILERFQNGHYQVLVAIKCLDEGVDIPSAKYGVILASSTNPREFIQRRGRLLRYHKNKDFSHIYDTFVIPPKMDDLGEDFKKHEKQIYKKEMKRFKEFASISNNSSECLLKLIQAEEENGIL